MDRGSRELNDRRHMAAGLAGNVKYATGPFDPS